ncbi:MAG: PadR family transcriptional regulator [Dermatophilaceae bacterium]|nr:PadR family transcriptional regulator [Dermatophilaceae bacterium]
MARTSQTRLAVLGALSVEPMTGYAVRAAIAETLGHFWHESFGQIYPTLAELEKDDLIRRTVPGLTSGAVFEITPTGTAELRQLLAEPFRRTPPRNGLLLRLFFGRHLGVEGCRQLLTEALAEAETSARRFAEIRAASDDEPASPDRPYWLMTLSAGEYAVRAQIAWLRESLDQLAPEDAQSQVGTCEGGTPLTLPALN